MLFWHVPAPNEAMLISGSKRQTQDTQFRIVTGHGSFVVPVKQKARMLSLALREAEITEDCVTQQGIRLNVRAVAVFKVGDDAVSIANAARRFLSEQEQMEELAGRIFAGHLRSIIGGLTVEQIIRERNRVSQEVIAGSHGEMEKLGIVVDALQIQEIDDATGYINNLAAPHAAAVASQARIAQARADQEAAEREQQAAALKAEYERDTAIKRAASSPRPSSTTPAPLRPDRWPRPGRPRRSSRSRRLWPSGRPRWPHSGWRRRSGVRRTPRRTGSARSPRPPGTGRSSRPTATRTPNGPWPRRRPTPTPPAPPRSGTATRN